MSRLLIVDDDQDFAETLATVMRGESHEVEIRNSPEEALESIDEEAFDAVLLDVMFPEDDSAGFKLAREIRRQKEDLPILLITAVNQRFPLGFNMKDADPEWLPVADFIEKPPDFDVLKSKVARLLEQA
jgi:CheY-like chemotaxis protein